MRVPECVMRDAADAGLLARGPHWQISPARLDRALMRAQLQKDRPDLAQVVSHERLAAIEPQRLDLLPQLHARELRVVLHKRWISSLNGSSFDGRSGTENAGG